MKLVPKKLIYKKKVQYQYHIGYLYGQNWKMIFTVPKGSISTVFKMAKLLGLVGYALPTKILYIILK